MFFKNFWLNIVLCTSIFWQILEVYMFYYNEESDSNYSYVQDALMEKMEVNPVKDIYVISNAAECPSGSANTVLFLWNGLENGCLCTDPTNTTRFLYHSSKCVSTKEMGCIQIERVDPQIRRSWKNYKICIENYQSNELFFIDNANTNCNNATTCGMMCSTSSCPISSINISFENGTINEIIRVNNSYDDILHSFRVSYINGPCINNALTPLRDTNTFFKLEKTTRGCDHFGYQCKNNQPTDSQLEYDFFRIWMENLNLTSEGLNLFESFLQEQQSYLYLFATSQLKLNYSNPECQNISRAQINNDINKFRKTTSNCQMPLWVGIFILLFLLLVGLLPTDQNRIGAFHIMAGLYYILVIIRYLMIKNSIFNGLSSSNVLLKIFENSCFTNNNYNQVIYQIQAYYLKNFNVYLWINAANLICCFIFFFIIVSMIVEKGFNQANYWKQHALRILRRTANIPEEENQPLHMDNFQRVPE